MDESSKGGTTFVIIENKDPNPAPSKEETPLSDAGEVQYSDASDPTPAPSKEGTSIISEAGEAQYELTADGTASIATSISEDDMPTKTFVVIPKNLNNNFFDFVHAGCDHQANMMSNENERVVCEFVGPVDPITEDQIAVVRQILDRQPPVDGIAIAVLDADALTPILREARQSYGIPVVTFDSDCLPEGRSTYIGTDNWAMGQMLGKILQQLHPQGGIYALASDPAPNVAERERGAREHLQQYEQWRESTSSPKMVEDSIAVSMDVMHQFAALQSNASDDGLDAIIPLGGWPMFDTTGWRSFVDSNPNLTLVVGDTLPLQIDLLMNGYVDGLVGQVPREMGVQSIQSLHALSLGQPVSSTVFLTFLMEMVKVPLVLPALELDENHVGNLRWIGVSLFVIVALTVIFCIGWTLTKRKVRVVSASQPLFLIIIALGAGIMGSALVPLSFDDTDQEVYLEEGRGDIICMSVPWLCCVGFALSFSALFSKTWRINRIFHGRHFQRSTVQAKEVIVPGLLLVGGNIIVLSTWTILDPLQYHRLPHQGTDVWNRVISYYGACRSQDSAMPYLVALAALNLSVLVIANWQAYEARSIKSDFAESNYIAILMMSMLQAGLTGIPILIIAREMPQAFYLILVLMIFCMSMAICAFIFVPKIIYERKYQRQTPEERRTAVSRAVQRSGYKASKVPVSSEAYYRSKVESQMEGNSFVPRQTQQPSHFSESAPSVEFHLPSSGEKMSPDQASNTGSLALSHE